MAHYNFLSDLKQSEIGVAIAREELKREYPGYTIGDLERGRQGEGDISVLGADEDGVHEFTFEIKYDIMSEKTGNLCFEVSNGKGPTGIFKTSADEVWYVVPNGENFLIYKFNKNILVQFLEDPNSKEHIRKTKGGDKWKFTLLLVKRDFAATIAYDVLEV